MLYFSGFMEVSTPQTEGEFMHQTLSTIKIQFPLHLYWIDTTTKLKNISVIPERYTFKIQITPCKRVIQKGAHFFLQCAYLYYKRTLSPIHTRFTKQNLGRTHTVCSSQIEPCRHWKLLQFMNKIHPYFSQFYKKSIIQFKCVSSDKDAH